MAGRWIDNNQDQGRARADARDDYGRDREGRTFERQRPGSYSARRSGLNRDPVFGEGESGASYGGPARRGSSPNFASQDYTGGGRFYGDDSREGIYREEYGQRGRDYGAAPRGYDAQRNDGRNAPDRDGGRARDNDRGESFEDAGQRAGEFLHRAGERVAGWFAGGEARATSESGNRGHRGLGPQGYKRSDERISEEVHERLTDDVWLDASRIEVLVAAGEVTLTGMVDSRDAKHRAEHIVEAVAGVTHVQNNLRKTEGAALARSTDDAVANGSGGAGSGQSTAGRKG